MAILNTIIIAHRDRYEYLECLLKSLYISKKKSNQEHEIVVVDLNSSRNISDMEILKECSNFMNVKVINVDYNEVFYKTKAINCGVLNSNGKYISLLDADTIVPIYYLQGIEDFYNNVENEQKKICYRVVRVNQKEKNELFRNIDENILNGLIERLTQFRMYLERYTEREIINKSFNIVNKGLLNKALGNSHFTLPKENFIKVGGYNEKMIGWGCEDKEFNLRYYRKFKNGVLREDNKYICFSLPCNYEHNWRIESLHIKNKLIYQKTINSGIYELPIGENWGKFI